MDDPYLARISANAREDADYALDIPAIRSLVDTPLELDSRVSFFVGDNGSGKSTLVEAIAVASKLNAEGGGRVQSFQFATRSSHSRLHEALVLEGIPFRDAHEQVAGAVRDGSFVAPEPAGRMAPGPGAVRSALVAARERLTAV